jgi:hypothetical protein
VDKDDVLNIFSKGDVNNNDVSARDDRQIFQLKRSYLRIPTPIVECPTIDYLSNYTWYNTTTQNSIINNVSILQTTQASILNNVSSLNTAQDNYIQNLVGTHGLTTLVGGVPKTATVRIETSFYNNLVNTITTASILQTTTNSIISTLSTYTNTPKIMGKVFGSGSRGDKLGEVFTVTVESTGQYLLSWTTYQASTSTIMMATINATPPNGAQSVSIQHVSATSARVNTYSGSTPTAVAFSFIIY